MSKWLTSILFLLLISLVSCGGSGSNLPPSSAPPSVPGTAASPPAPGSVPPGSIPPPAGSTPPAIPVPAQSVDQLSRAGMAVYANNCIKCHGDKGQGVTGPAVIGPTASLAKYNTAKGLYDYVSTKMPAFAPGSLPPPAYFQVLAYLLVENKVIASGTTLDPAQLNNIKLSK